MISSKTWAKLFVPLIVCSLILSACGTLPEPEAVPAEEGVQAVQNLIPLQEQLATEYGESNIKVEIEDGNALGITFVNSSSNGLAWDQKAEQAREIALFVCENYASMDRIAQVWVAFEIHQDGSIVDTTSSVTFDFKKSELECGESMYKE